MPTTRASARLLALCAVLAMAVACASTTPRVVGGAVDKASDLTVWLGPSGTLHPHSADANITAALFAPLVAIDPTTHRAVWGDQAPAALLQDVRSDDLRRWELTLKPDRVWHDGAQVTTEDLERGWQIAIEAGLPQQAVLEEVRIVDKQQVNVFLSGPYASFPELLAAPAFLPLPAAAIDSPMDFEALPVGTGSFRATIATDDQVILDAVPGHPVPAATDRVVVSRTTEPSPSDDVLIGADGRRGPSPLREDQQVTNVAGGQFVYLGLPLDDPRFADPDLRQALSQAIDRQTLTQTVLGGAAVPADRILGPGQERLDGVSCSDCVFDPDAAAAALPDGFSGPLTLWFTEDPLQQPVIEFLAESWRRVLGIDDIVLASAPPGELLAQLADGAVDGPFRVAWEPDVPAATRTLQPLFGDQGEANDGPYVNDEVDALLDEADQTADASARAALQARAEAIVLDDLPIIPLWFSSITIVADPDVTISVDGRGRVDWPSLQAG